LAVVLVAALALVAVFASVSGTSGAKDKTLTIAFLDGAKGNAFADASLKGITAEAKKRHVKLAVSDAQFNPQKQLGQCQDAVTKKVDAIVSLAAAGVPLIPCAGAARKAGIPFIAANQPIGTSTKTGKPTTKGVTSQILTPLDKVAGTDAALVAKACGKSNPCNVVDLIAAKIIPVQASAYKAALGRIQKKNPRIKITTVEAGADRAGGLKAMQDTLQRVSKPTVVVAPNTQPILGAAQALREAGKKPGGNVKLVANGASKETLAGVKSGAFFATYTQLPQTEAKLALVYAIRAANGKKVPAWTDPHSLHRTPFYLTKASAKKVRFTPQW